jgi:hypothetical protein
MLHEKQGQSHLPVQETKYNFFDNPGRPYSHFTLFFYVDSANYDKLRSDMVHCISYTKNRYQQECRQWCTAGPRTLN